MIRTTEFAKSVILLCRKIPQDAVNDRLIRQVVGSSGSIGANYREANDCLGLKDFVYRLKIARKEAFETSHWLELLKTANPTKSEEIEVLQDECNQITKILSAIISKSIQSKLK